MLRLVIAASRGKSGRSAGFDAESGLGTSGVELFMATLDADLEMFVP